MRHPISPARLLLADPPWLFDDKMGKRTRGSENHYRCLALDEIKAYPLPPLADDCLLLLWRVSAMVEEAYQVVRARGFAPKSEIVWYKQTSGGLPWFGMGRYVRAAHETCIIATRGRFLVDNHAVRSVFAAEAGNRHSAKPGAFYELAEALCHDGPWCELFARQQRPRWRQYGDELIGGRTMPAALRKVGLKGA